MESNVVSRGRRPGAAFAIALLLASSPSWADAGKPLDYDEALRLARRDAPSLAAREASVAAAAAERTRAGRLPDPSLMLALENLPTTGVDRGSLGADFMTMRRIGLMQEFPSRRKRDLAHERAGAELERSAIEAQVEAARLDEAVALAWLQRWSIDSLERLLAGQQARIDLAVATADAAVAGNAAGSAGALLARVMRSTWADRARMLQQAREQASARLARWLPVDGARAPGVPPDWHASPLPDSDEALDWHRHRLLASTPSMTRVAQAELSLALAGRRPDWSLEVGYAERGPGYSDMLSLGVRLPLPLFPRHRQDAAVVARRADLARVEAEREAAWREARAEIGELRASWRATRDRLERARTESIPLADDRAEAALAAYRSGRGPLAEAIEGLNAASEARMAAVERETELAQAWIGMRYAFVADSTGTPVDRGAADAGPERDILAGTTREHAP